MKWLFIDNNSIDEKYLTDYIEFEKEPSRICISDEEYHKWVFQLFCKNDYCGIIMPLSKDDITPDGLYFGLHLRLNYELPKSKRCTPIIFISDYSLDSVFAKFSFDSVNNPQCLLFTEGVIVTDIYSIDEAITNVKKPNANNDYDKILSQLNIHRKSTSGHHDIANSWGCFKLSQVLGCEQEILENPKISFQLKELYAKFLICQNETNIPETTSVISKPNCSGKRILYIDDKADEGWDIIMKNIFTDAGDGFVYIDSAIFKQDGYFDYPKFHSECMSHISEEWDLIIIDLRLDPEYEDIDNKIIDPKSLSGFLLAEAFLDENEGNQIIALTASNKVWNIQALLERGVSDYYIKESPTNNHSFVDTYTQYQDLIKKIDSCFDRSLYLRNAFKKWQVIQNLSFAYVDNDQYNDFYQKCDVNLKISFELLKKAFNSSETNVRKKYLSYSYFQLFLIIEDFTKLPNVFLYDYTLGRAYIMYHGQNRYYILRKKESKNKKAVFDCMMTYHEKSEAVKYAYYDIENNDFDRDIDLNFKVSSLLLFIFGFKSSNSLYWISLAKKRNGIAHSNPKNEIKEKDYERLLNFILFILDKNNINPVNSLYSFPEDPIEDED